MIEIIALSDAMREVMRLAELVAPREANVLITGESGTGKDAVARFIHTKSKRAQAGEYVKIDCAALPAELLEAELFGYERGAFTGATSQKPGRLEAAHKGTLVLDEVAHLSTDAQAKLLRVIEAREFERLGGSRTVKVDARLIALTNVDLQASVGRRAFREDLFYRLNVVQIHLPPLREHREDVMPLTERFLQASARKHGRAIRRLAPQTRMFLEEYDFPGNVRELAHAIERACIVASGDTLEVADLPENLRASVEHHRRTRHRLTLAEVEAAYIQETLAATKGNKAQAARFLGISRKNLYEKLARYSSEAMTEETGRNENLTEK